MEKPLKVRLHILSPIHIGCDDVYEPTSFVIDEKKGKLIEFDPMVFIKALNKQERDELSKVCSGDNLLSILKTIKRLYRPNIKGHEVDIASGLLDHYKKVQTLSTYDKKVVINQFTMQRTAYNPLNNLPYIPGSSLKGSLRTAYLSSLAQENGINSYWKSSGLLSRQDLEKPEYIYKQIGKKHVAKKLEQNLLKGDFATDPFRMIKVSDLLPEGQIKTRIVYSVNKNKKEGNKATLAGKGDVYQIFEIIQSGAVFEGTINIEQPNKKSEIKSPITEDKLKKVINKFFIPLLESEIKILKALSIQVPLINEINQKFKGKINKTAFLIRIGRHSGAEAVTVEGNRFVKIKLPDTQYTYLNHATTLWLASEEAKPKNNNGLVPFGWAVMEVVE
ncbi:MAG: type III-A CRISPR-associated RAMP protein Csm5 [Nitrospirota bacterium]